MSKRGKMVKPTKREIAEALVTLWRSLDDDLSEAEYERIEAVVLRLTSRKDATNVPENVTGAE